MSAAAVKVPEQEEMLVGGSAALVRQQAAEVLAAHRQRRQRNAGEATGRGHGVEEELASSGRSRAERIASRVTERYAQTQSYRSFLAAAAEEATRKAKAAAEVAARTAQAVASVQRELLEELASSAKAAEEVQASAENVCEVDAPKEWRVPASRSFGEEAEEPRSPVAQVTREGLTVRLFEDVGLVSRSESPRFVQRDEGSGEEDFEEARALDEEISFRQSPTFDLERASVSIPGNLLEFPRQLVAARKARPRFAEGPLREDGGDEHDGVQLRIFEVEADQITLAPPVESSTPEWSSIWLDALAEDAPEEAAELVPGAAMARIYAAPLERRMMAGIVDGCLIGAGFVAFATVFAYCAAALPSLPVAAISSVGILVAIGVIYQMLFFTLAEATPGMRYARIGLCTFDEENPTRTAMLGRMMATMVALCPLGLGFLWALLDDDRIGWHDRISRMYQRSY